jgi:alpha-galactosidase
VNHFTWITEAKYRNIDIMPLYRVFPQIKMFGCCHEVFATLKLLCDSLDEFGGIPNVKRHDVKANVVGVNHFTWITDIRIDGRDVFPEFRDKFIESGAAAKRPISLELFDIYGCYPAPGDRHVTEFVPYYLKDEVLREKDYEWKNNDFVATDSWRAEGKALLEAIRTGEDRYSELLCGSGETATHFIRALMNGGQAIEMVNVINNGYIDNVSDVIVEIPTYIDQFGLHPQKIGNLPAGIAAQCDRLGREYVIMVDAAVKCDYKLARQAMFLDPLCANCKYPEALLKDLIRENLDLLPEGWEEELNKYS